MACLAISNAHILAAEAEASAATRMFFGDRKWEQAILRQPDLWILIIDEISGAEAYGMRTLLTAFYGVILEARGGTLPDVTTRSWADISAAYKGDVDGFGAIADVLAGHMERYSKTWASLFFKRAHALSVRDVVTAYKLCLLLLQAQDEEADGVAGYVPDAFYTEPEKNPPTDEKPPEPEKPETPAGASTTTEEKPTVVITDTGVTFDDIGGYAKVKQQLMSLGDAVLHPQLWSHWGTYVPRGVLLDGPPGNGKTFMVKALATYTQKPLISVCVGDIGTKWVNESANHLKKKFDEAVKAGAILFLDEADTIVRSRQARDSFSEDEKVLSVFNVCMQRPVKPDGILVVMATNLRHKMDEAAIRAGRIDRVIHVPLPDAHDRREVFVVHAKKAESIAGRKLFARSISKSLIVATEGFCCADIQELVRRALERKAEADIRGIRSGVVTSEELLAVVAEQNSERATEKARRIGYQTPV